MASAASRPKTDALYSMLMWMGANVCLSGVVIWVLIRRLRCALNDDEPGVSLGKVESRVGHLRKGKHRKKARMLAVESDKTAVAARRPSCSPCRVKVHEGIQVVAAVCGKVRKFRAHREVNTDHLCVRETKSDPLGKCEVCREEELLAFGPVRMAARVSRPDSLQKSKAFKSLERMVTNYREPPPTPGKRLAKFST